jgi:hypothetical protein
MAKLESFRAVLLLWPKYADMAKDVGNDCTAERVKKWAQRDNIPSSWWASVLATKRARAAGLSSDAFTRLAARSLERAGA